MTVGREVWKWLVIEMLPQQTSRDLNIHTYSWSTYFRLELIEPSAREIFIFWTLVEREERREEENMAQTYQDSKKRQS